MKTNPPSIGFMYPTLAVSQTRLVDLHQKVVASGCRYELGAKVAGSVPIGRFHLVDCSGYVRRLLAEFGIEIKDGSFNQHEQVRELGFKKSDGAN